MSVDAAAVYRNLSAAVLGYLRAQGAREPEDLLGEVFVQVARDLRTFPEADDATAVRRWVFAIARNRVIDAARRARRRPGHSGDDVPERPAPATDEAPDPDLVAALQGLTPDQREVVALRFVADLSLDEVARITGRRVGAVKSLQHRALENLRAAVSQENRPAL